MAGAEMSFFEELKRRNVVRVGIAYLVAAWLLLQFTDVMIQLMELPASLGKIIVWVLLLGFLPVLVFAWVWELTPEGLKREKDIDREVSTTTNTGRSLNAVIVVMLAVAAGYFFWESRFKEDSAVLTEANEIVTSTATTGARNNAELVIEDKSVAVLPFVNMSADPENEYFADGLSEEILNRLAQVSALRVIGRTSSFSFKGQNRDLREVGEILGSSTVLEGSVRRQGNIVRVTAQLIATSDGTHLWSQTYDRQMDDIFAIQDEIAQNVVVALDVVLDEDTRRDMMEAGVRNVDAFVAFQKGYQLMVAAHGRETMMADLYEANRYFDDAIKAAPGFAEAYSQKTDYYAHVVLDEDFSRGLEEREEALETMLELLGIAYEKARDERRRLTIDRDRTFFSEDWSRLPGLLDKLFVTEGCADGSWMELAGPFVDMTLLLEHYERQIECEPMMLLSYSMVAEIYAQMDEMNEAQAVIDKGVRVGGEHRWLATGQRLLDIQTGKAEELLEELQRASAAEGRSISNRRRQLLYLALLGREGEARELFDELLAEGVMNASDSIVTAARLGDLALANAMAAKLDSQPGGSAELIRVINSCHCGAPFEIAATPGFAARLASAGWTLNVPATLNFPAKTW